MKIAVMGAGAVGCYFGALLARAGHPVVLIGRPAHVAAIKARGLILETQAGAQNVILEATEEPSGVVGADVVLLCAKSTDTEEAGRQIREHLTAHAIILSLQNGVENAYILAAILGTPVIPAVVYVAAEMAAPGHVRHKGRGDLVFGSSPLSIRIAAEFEKAAIPVRVSDNIRGALWSKLILNCAWNALSAITRMPYGEMAGVEGVSSVVEDVVEECLAVAGVLNVSPEGDIHQAVRAIVAAMPDQSSSTAQDLARGRKSEIDYLNGFIVRKGVETGIPTPVNRVLDTLVRVMETRVDV